MEIVTLTDSSVLSSNTYLIISGAVFSVVDPSVSYEKAKAAFSELDGCKAGYVLLTHGHFDHIRAIQSYVDAGCEVLVTEHDADVATDPARNCAVILGENVTYKGGYRGIRGGELLDIGEDILTVIETPGHTAGSVCYLGEGIIFTGDTLFAHGFGRCDVFSSSIQSMRQSLGKLFALDGNTVIYPGHGPCSTIDEAKTFFG